MLLPFLLLVFLNSQMPNFVQWIQVTQLRLESIEGVTFSVNNAQHSYVQVEGSEVSIEDFPKRETEKDDTERIQRAVDYCVDNDRDLFFPSGSSYILRSVNLEAGCGSFILRQLSFWQTINPNLPGCSRPNIGNGKILRTPII